jgi:hypothetical protein
MAKNIDVTTLAIARTFDHKVHGRVGVIQMQADVGLFTIDGKTLPQSSVEYLLTFALQSFQDAYAGAENAEDAVGRFNKKLDRVIAGTIGLREAGDGASAETKAIRGVIGDMLRAAKQWQTVIGELDEDKRADMLDAIFAKQPEAKQATIRATAQERMAEAAARKAQAKELASGLSL